MAEVLCDQDDGHGRNHQHGFGVEHRGGKIGHADPGCVQNTRQVERLAQAHAVGQYSVDQCRHNQADQNQQTLHHAAREHGHHGHADEGDGLHPAVKVAGGHVLDRYAGQVQPDNGHDGAGNHRRHQFFDPAGARDLHQQADCGVGGAAGDDAAQCHANIRVEPLAGIAGGSNHDTDEGET